MRKRKKTGKVEENNYFRNFGSLSNDSVATDIYNKRLKNRKKVVESKKIKCMCRKMTDEDYEKYFGNKK